MSHEHGVELPIINQDSQACSCCVPAGREQEAAPSAQATDTVATYAVEGMTCSHCVSSVREELGAIDGVRTVQVELQVGGASRVTVTSLRPLDPSEVGKAIDEAGYELLAS